MDSFVESFVESLVESLQSEQNRNIIELEQYIVGQNMIIQHIDTKFLVEIVNLNLNECLIIINKFEKMLVIQLFNTVA